MSKVEDTSNWGKEEKIHLEEHLIALAQASPSSEIANKAMEILRREFNPKYFWCEDCDGLVITETLCCISNEEK